MDPELTDRLIEDAEGTDALPLLAFTLERLLIDYGSDGDLLVSEYQDLGGIGGSIEAAVRMAFETPGAEPTIPADQGQRETLLRRGFLPWMALIDPDTDERKRRVARWQEIPADARPLIERLITQRLLIRDRRRLDDGEEAVVVEVAHEALFRQWPLLSRWLDEDADALKSIHAAKQAAAQWSKNDRNPEWLTHRGERRREVEELLQRPDLDRLLGDQGRGYVRACRQRDDFDAAEAERQRKEKEEAEKKRLELEKEQAAEREQAERDRAEAARGLTRRTGVGAVIAVVLMLVAGALAWWAIQQERAAQRSLGDNYWASGVDAEEKDNPLASAHFYARATEKYPDKTAIESGLLKLRAVQMNRNPIALDAILGHDGDVFGASFSKDESRILTWSEDGTARLWGPKAGTQGMTEIARMAHDWIVRGAAFSKDETRILTWSLDNTARLWRAEDGAELTRMAHDGGVAGAAFSKDETRILTWSKDKTARLWRAEDGTELTRMGHDELVRGAAFSKDETRILTWSRDKTARLWRAEDGAELSRMGHDGDVWGAAFSKDETRILTWSGGIGGDNTARLWRAEDGAELTGMAHDWIVNGAAFSKDETRILTWSGGFGSSDNTARLWRAEDGAELSRMGHDDVIGAAFSKDETRILTWSSDGTVRLWNFAVDYDFPPEYIALQVEVLTGTAMDRIGNVRGLRAEEWKAKKAEYERIAEEHAATCRYPEANRYLKRKREAAARALEGSSP